MAEKFTFEQIPRDSGAIDAYQWPVAALATGMDGPGDQFLASARLTTDQHIGTGRRDHFDLTEQMPHRRTIPDHFAIIEFGLDFLLQVLVLPFEALLQGFHLSQRITQLSLGTLALADIAE